MIFMSHTPIVPNTSLCNTLKRQNLHWYYEIKRTLISLNSKVSDCISKQVLRFLTFLHLFTPGSKPKESRG
jgi:hypothetical protein